MPRIPVTIPQSPSNAGNTSSPGPAQHREHLGRQGNAVQSGVFSANQRSKANPFADGNMLSAISLSANTTKWINHGLGRAYVDAIQCIPLGACTITKVAPTTANPNTAVIGLQASANCTVSVWVF